MTEALLTTLYLTLPLIISGSLHMLVVSKNWFDWLRVPINMHAYGPNKTWRGVVVMLVATIPGVYAAQLLEPFLRGHLLVSLEDLSAIAMGLALGLGYVIPELPNSFIKRRLGIKPGERPHRYAFIFGLIDQADSAIGCTLVYGMVLAPPPAVMILMIALGPMVHVLANIALFSCGLRKQPF